MVWKLSTSWNDHKRNYEADSKPALNVLIILAQLSVEFFFYQTYIRRIIAKFRFVTVVSNNYLEHESSRSWKSQGKPVKFFTSYKLLLLAYNIYV